MGWTRCVLHNSTRLQLRIKNPAVWRHFCSALEGVGAVYDDYGPPSKVVKLRTFRKPQANQSLEQPNSVHVRMLAAPINPSDLNMIEGVYGIKPHLPAYGGNEGVGVVEWAHSSVTNLGVGDVVAPILNKQDTPGTWRTHLVCSEHDLIRLPENLPLEISSTLSVNPTTAWRLLHDFRELSRGDVIVQNGSSSAVGRSVIQFAQHRGIKSINVIRNQKDEEHVKLLRAHLLSLGADVVLTEHELANEAKRNSILRDAKLADRAATLAFNCVAGKTSADLCKLLRPGSTMVVYGGMSRRPVMIGSGQLIFDDIRVRGFWLSRWIQERVQKRQELQRQDRWCAENDEHYQMLNNIARILVDAPAYTASLKASLVRYPLQEISTALEFTTGSDAHMDSEGNAGIVPYVGSRKPLLVM